MRILEPVRIIDTGGLADSPVWREIEKHIRESIMAVQWPHGAGSFTINDQPGKKRGQGNGVKPIKTACMLSLEHLGWSLEQKLDIATLNRPGKLDAVLTRKGKTYCIEWETGNISSSHRALNKMAVGIITGKLAAGVLILPTRSMYRYLTDRVGNFEELQPYFMMWNALRVKEGLLIVQPIEHDAVSRDVPRIPKGTDGRALL
jgi:hypothetical protein